MKSAVRLLRMVRAGIKMEAAVPLNHSSIVRNMPCYESKVPWFFPGEQENVSEKGIFV